MSKSPHLRKKKKRYYNSSRALRFNFFHARYDVIFRVAAQEYADPEDTTPLPEKLSRELAEYDKIDRRTDIVWIDRTPTYDFFSKNTNWRKVKRISRFPQFRKLCAKCFLSRCLNRLKFFFPTDFDFYPQTFVLPQDKKSFLKQKVRKKKIWISKPSLGSEGRGLILQGTNAMKKTILGGKVLERDTVVQEYVNNPFTLSGYKFDLRLYVLITSLDPLEVYLYNNGLVRQATEKYKSSAQLHNHFMHLTNSSLNKLNTKAYAELGCKKDFSFLNTYLEKRGYKPEKLWSDIEDLIMKTIIAIRPHGSLYYRHCFPHSETSKKCFHILGFDVLIQQSPDLVLKPILLEINNQPSLRMDTATDYVVKEELIRDTLSLIGDDLTGTLRDEYTYGFKRLEYKNHYKLIDIFSGKRVRDVFQRAVGVRSHRLEMSGTRLLSYIRQSGILRRKRRRTMFPQIDIMFAEMSRKYGKIFIDFNDFLDIIVSFAKRLYMNGNRSPFSALYTLFQRHFRE